MILPQAIPIPHEPILSKAPRHGASSDTPLPLKKQSSLVIVEDDSALRELLALQLCGEGYNVRSAENGEAGWSSLSSAPFDLLITDFEMPKLSGLDLLQRMRTSSFQQPVILMSGNLPRAKADREKWLFPGTAMAKPFKLPDLVAAIQALLTPMDGMETPHTLNSHDPVE
ncbi:MAG: response regulator [Opitutales bacterium]|nr:response regulator [Opitutales bacterium]MCH8539764.1 response regulator [Opitutales bacterium]